MKAALGNKSSEIAEGGGDEGDEYDDDAADAGADTAMQKKVPPELCCCFATAPQPRPPPRAYAYAASSRCRGGCTARQTIFFIMPK